MEKVWKKAAFSASIEGYVAFVEENGLPNGKGRIARLRQLQSALEGYALWGYDEALLEGIAQRRGRMLVTAERIEEIPSFYLIRDEEERVGVEERLLIEEGIILSSWLRLQG